jgi:RNA polymerase sigma-70 factor (ECF subfamily)
MTERSTGGPSHPAQEGVQHSSPDELPESTLADAQSGEFGQTVADVEITAGMADTLVDVAVHPGVVSQPGEELGEKRNKAGLPQQELPAGPAQLAPTPWSSASHPVTRELILREVTPRIYNLVRRLLSDVTTSCDGSESPAKTRADLGKVQQSAIQEAIEQITQNVIIQVGRKLSSFRGEAEFNSWLYRFTVESALHYRRQQSSRAAANCTTAEDKRAPKPATGATRVGSESPQPEALRLVEQAVARLPAAYRDIFVLADIEGLSHAEVAGALGLGSDLVKARLHRARLLLGDALAPYFREGHSG